LRREKYTHGHAPATVRQPARRTVEEAAAFLLAPGQVIGLDLSSETLAAARQDAVARGLAKLANAAEVTDLQITASL
jgi:hypothetical protein